MARCEATRIAPVPLGGAREPPIATEPSGAGRKTTAWSARDLGAAEVEAQPLARDVDAGDVRPGRQRQRLGRARRHRPAVEGDGEDAVSRSVERGAKPAPGSGAVSRTGARFQGEAPGATQAATANDPAARSWAGPAPRVERPMEAQDGIGHDVSAPSTRPP